MAHHDLVRDSIQYGICKSDAIRSVAKSSMGSASSSRYSVQLAVLGESRAGSKDDFISNTWCESEDV